MPRDLDPYGPLMQAKGLARGVDVKSDAEPADPEAAEIQAITQRSARKRAAERLERLRMQEAEQAEKEARIENNKLDLEAAKTEAQVVELNNHLREIRDSQGGGQGSDLMTLMLTKLMQDQESARAEAATVRQTMTEQLTAQLAEFRQDMRAQMAGGEAKRPPAVELEENIGQLSALRNAMAEFLPRAQLATAGGDIDTTIRQLQLQQDFELRKEQMVMERERLTREWDERRDAREKEIQLQREELLVRERRNQTLANTLDRFTPRLADALSGLAPGTPPAAGGGGGSAPERIPGQAGTLHCLNCQTPIVISVADSQVTCPRCGRVYPLNRQAD